MRLDTAEIVRRVRSALPPGRAGLHDPWGSAAHCVVGDLEKPIRDFKDALQTQTRADCVVPTCSGTAALHMALVASGVEPGDEVLVPTLTFVATANAVVHAGAVPNFIGGELHVNPYKLQRYLERETRPRGDRRGRDNVRTGRRISAVIPVHLLGHPAPMAELVRLAGAYGLTVIEDASQALGSLSGGIQCGRHSTAGVLSFNLNKVVTTHGGGALLTDNEWVAAQAWRLTTTARAAKQPWEVWHDAVAWNYRMGPINAAVGVDQLGRLDDALAAKSRLVGAYRKALHGARGIELLEPRGLDGDQSNNWLAAVVLDPRCADQRTELMAALWADGIQVREMFPPLHTMPMYRENPRDQNLQCAEHWSRRVICLPSGPGLAPCA